VSEPLSRTGKKHPIFSSKLLKSMVEAVSSAGCTSHSCSSDVNPFCFAVRGIRGGQQKVLDNSANLDVRLNVVLNIENSASCQTLEFPDIKRRLVFTMHFGG
jgi:hypothetical protein